MTGWFDLAAAVLPTAIQVGSSLYGQKAAADANKDAARTTGEVSGQAAGTLKSGYDQQLSALLGVTPELRQNYADRYAGTAALYQPYTQAGQQGLAGVQAVASRDPGTLSPEQQRAMDDYRRGAASRLAASGLRGAGRAGVASVNEGDAKLRASMFDANQRRGDAANSDLLRYGYQGAGQQASALGQLFGSNAVLSATDAQLVGNTAMDKSKTDAAAQGSAGSALVAAQQANGQSWGSTLGSLGSVMASEMKDRNKSRWASDTSNTAANPITWGPAATTIWDPPGTGNNQITWS
jgi:hypothetical protein